MSNAKSTQTVKSGQGYGTDNPKNSQNIVNQGKPGHKVPALGSIGTVPDLSRPEHTRGGKG